MTSRGLFFWVIGRLLHQFSCRLMDLTSLEFQSESTNCVVLNWDLDGKPKANNPRLIENAYRRHPEVATVYRGPVSRWRMTIVKRKEHEAATSSKVIRSDPAKTQSTENRILYFRWTLDKAEHQVVSSRHLQRTALTPRALSVAAVVGRLDDCKPQPPAIVTITSCAPRSENVFSRTTLMPLFVPPRPAREACVQWR
jgi:hypothetical protein